MDKSTLDFFPSDPISPITTLPSNRPQDARSGSAHQTYPGSGELFLMEYEDILLYISKKCCQNWRKDESATFHYRPGVKVGLTRENGKITSNTRSTGYV